MASKIPHFTLKTQRSYSKTRDSRLITQNSYSILINKDGNDNADCFCPDTLILAPHLESSELLSTILRPLLLYGR